MLSLRAALLVVLLFVSPARAADITLTLSDEEQRVLREILDIATKAAGLSVAPATLHFASKIEAQKQPPKPSPEGPK